MYVWFLSWSPVRIIKSDKYPFGAWDYYTGEQDIRDLKIVEKISKRGFVIDRLAPDATGK